MNLSRRTYTFLLALVFFIALALIIATSVSRKDANAQEPKSGAADAFLPAVLAPGQETKPLFSDLTGDVELDPEEQYVLDVLKSDPSTTRLALTGIDLSLLKSAASIELNLFNDTTTRVTTDRVETRSKDDFTWYGSNPETGTMATITVMNGSAIGTVVTEDGVYKLVPIADGVHANTEVDFSVQEGSDHPPEFEIIQRESSTRQSSFLQALETINILVVYTQTARNQVANMDALIQLAIDETNNSFVNSGINRRVALVHSYQIAYAESGDMYLDLTRLRTQNDGFMDSVHANRSTYSADVVMMITARHNDYCGLATRILADYAYAFAITTQKCATGYYTFGHELGHLLGARHNPEVDPNTQPFQYGHGYYPPSQNWRTMMSYDCPERCSRIPYWSNPSLTYRGERMGTTETHDNARVLNGDAPPPPPPITLTPTRVPAVLQNPSFESGSRLPWAFLSYNSACNWAVYPWPDVAREGQYLLATNENGNNPDCTGFHQDINRNPEIGESYRFAIWVRSAGPPRNGQLALWALGGQQEVAPVDFSGVGPAWQCVETQLTVQRGGHSGLRAEVYLYSDDTVDYYFDSAALTLNTGSLCPSQPPPTATPTATATATPTPTPTPTPTATALAVPTPELAFVSRQDGYFYLTVVNWASFPAELFDRAPDLPPCGLNTSASRTWVRIYDSADNYLKGYCAFGDPEDLAEFWFWIKDGVSPPDLVYLILHDRRTDTIYRSNYVDVTP